MTTATEIVNRALAAIGTRSTVADVEVEQSAEAKAARLMYASTRDAMLRGAHWNFARADATLTLLKAAPGTPENPTSATVWNQTMPPRPWLYQYEYPRDAALIRYVQPTQDFSPYPANLFSVSLPGNIGAGAASYARFQVGSALLGTGQRVVAVNTSARAAVVCYTAIIDNEEMWDALFQEAMVAALASRFAMALTGELTMARSMAQQATQALRDARAADGNEGTTTTDYTPDWLRVRGVGGTAVADTGFAAGWVNPSFLQV